MKISARRRPVIAGAVTFAVGTLFIGADASAQARSFEKRKQAKSPHTTPSPSVTVRVLRAKATGQIIGVSGKVLLHAGPDANGAPTPARSLDQFRVGDKIVVAPGANATVIFYGVGQRYRLTDTTVEIKTEGLRRVSGKEPVLLRPLSGGMLRVVPANVGNTFSLNAGALVSRTPGKLPFRRTITHPKQLRCVDPEGSIVLAPLADTNSVPAETLALRWAAPTGFAPQVSLWQDDQPVLQKTLDADTTEFAIPVSKLQPGIWYKWRVEGAITETNGAEPSVVPAVAETWVRVLTPAEVADAQKSLGEAATTEREDPADVTPELLALGVYLKYGLNSEALKAAEAALRRRPEDTGLRDCVQSLRADVKR